MADVFISYAREDREMAIRLAEAIESYGWTVWWDRRIPAGRSYEDAIEHEINQAACVIVLWTSKSIASEWVRNEAGEGSRRKILIPIRLEDVRLPLSFRHLQADDLLRWTSTEIKDCLASIESMIGPPSKSRSDPFVVKPTLSGITDPELPLPETLAAKPTVGATAKVVYPTDSTAKNGVPSVDPLISPQWFTRTAMEIANPGLPLSETLGSKPTDHAAPAVVEYTGTLAIQPLLSPLPSTRPRPDNDMRRWKIWIAALVSVVLVLLIIWLLAPTPKREADNESAGTTNVDTSTTTHPNTETTNTTTTAAWTATMRTTTILSPDPVSMFVSATDTTSTSAMTPKPVAAMKDVVDFQTSDGTFTIELFPSAAPKHVSSFIRTALSGGFDGVEVFVVKDYGIAASTRATADIPQEVNDIAYTRGTVMGLGRSNGTDIGAAFYIAARDHPNLDRHENTVFGRVIAGMDIVDRMSNAPADANHRPLKPITITQAFPRTR